MPEGWNVNARIEFCGVPASGKSTLCAEVHRLLRARGQRMLDRAGVVEAGLRKRDFGWLGNRLAAWVPGWRREFLGLPHGLNDWHRFAVYHPEFVARIHVWLAETETDASWRSTVFYSFLATAFEFELAQMAGTPTLLDEGFAQRFFTLRGYRGLGRSGDAAAYAAAMPRPDGLVLVATPAAVCKVRLEERAALPVLLEGDPALGRRLDEGQTLLVELTSALENRGVPVFRADGAGHLEGEASRIADFIQSALNP